MALVEIFLSALLSALFDKLTSLELLKHARQEAEKAGKIFEDDLGRPY